MRSWLRWRSDRTAQLLIIILFLSHLPFIISDPDKEISFSRGPFTDEGLNTIQVRNLINHGYLSFKECDNLLKTPLLAITLALPFLVFGTKLIVARLTILILVLLALFILFRKKPFSGFLLILIPVLFFKYQVFQFSHFSMAEMLAASSILTGIFFLWKAYQPFSREKDGFFASILAAVFVSMAYFFKIQFLYIIPLLPVMAIERAIFARGLSYRSRMGNGLLIATVTILLLVIYILAWYLPFKGTYDYMMAHQSGGLEISRNSIRIVGFNIVYFLFSSDNIYFTITFIACVIIGTILLFRKVSGSYPLLFKSSLIWFLLESHKLLMVYWPTRYQVSMYVAMGLLIAVVFYELINNGELYGQRIRLKRPVQAIVFACIAVLFIFNLVSYFKTLDRREYVIRDTNHYLAETLNEEDIAIGAWAPSLTWDAKCKSFPVWGGFLNDVDPIGKFHPRVVISEPDEQDSEQAYKKQVIDLKSISDSTRTFPLGQWVVNVYWLH
jgi:hypothetical protein